MSHEAMRLYGSGKIPVEAVGLRAGPVELLFDDGDLRTIRLNQVEVVRRVYTAVRDRNWGTVPSRLSNLVIEQQEDRFRITFAVENRANEIDFGWRGEISGDTDGTLRYTLEGEARSTFLRNRIGFCVLHPAGLAGTVCQVERVEGVLVRGVLPQDISPDQPLMPFTDMRALTHPAGPGWEVELRFEGDAFEMEDQRNWTDASFKTFCTPLRLPYPIEIQAGTIIRQTISLRVKAVETKSVGGAPVILRRNGAELETVVDWEGVAVPLPGLGFGSASDDKALDSLEIERLRELKPHHLRVDINLGAAGWAERFQRVCTEAKKLGTRVVPALFVPEGGQPAPDRLARLYAELEPDVPAWLVYAQKESYQGGTPTAQAVKQVRAALPQAKIGAGTNTDLIFLKRNVPPLDQVDLVCFAINPQVHSFDNLSLVETLEAQSTAVESARRLAHGLPVAVSPVTFKPRWNPYATAAPPPVAPGELPAEVDPRQLSLFGAAWTLGSITALARGGAAWVTYYETAGWRGLMERAAGSSAPLRFPSTAGELFPLYAVFKALADFAGGEVLPVGISAPAKAVALAVRKGENRALLLANLEGKSRRIVVDGNMQVLGPFEFKILAK
jgi:hypothetical protein